MVVHLLVSINYGAHTTVGTYFASSKKKHISSFFAYLFYKIKWMIIDLNIPQSFSEEMLFLPLPVSVAIPAADCSNSCLPIIILLV